MAHRPILGGCFAVIMVICDKAKGFKFSKRPLQKKSKLFLVFCTDLVNLKNLNNFVKKKHLFV